MLRVGDHQLSRPRISKDAARKQRAELASLIRSDAWTFVRGWIEEQQHNALIAASKSTSDADMRNNVARWRALEDVKAWPSDTVEELERLLRPQGEEADG